MLGETIARVSRIVPRRNIFVVTGEVLRGAVQRELPELRKDQILCEPTGRNTAACIAWAALEIEKRDPEAVMLVLPADHVVAPLGAYLADMQRGLAVANEERCLVTFGISPTHPETGYGYLRAGDAVGMPWPSASVRRVAAFHEKPNVAKARRFLSGGFYWNSGMFAWRADVIREELAAYLPKLAAGVAALDRTRKRGGIPTKELLARYPRLEAISIDHGVMEKSRRVVMVIASFRWSDIGSWDAVGSLWPRDAHGNASRDPVLAIDSRNNVIATRAKPVALVGVSGLAIVDAGDALLICSRQRAQDVRAVVSALDAAKLSRLR